MDEHTVHAVGALLAATLGTLALRHASVRVLAGRALPPAVGIALRHSALGVMAVILTSSLPTTGRLGLPTLAAVAAASAAAVVARRTGNTAVTVAAGVAVYAALR